MAAKNTTPVGITFSSPEDLKSWAGEVGLDAPLLSDPTRATALAYGAAESADQERPKRISVLIDGEGRIEKLYEVADAEGHAAEVLADLG